MYADSISREGRGEGAVSVHIEVILECLPMRHDYSFPPAPPSPPSPLSPCNGGVVPLARQMLCLLSCWNSAPLANQFNSSSHPAVLFLSGPM